MGSAWRSQRTVIGSAQSHHRMQQAVILERPSRASIPVDDSSATARTALEKRLQTGSKFELLARSLARPSWVLREDQIKLQKPTASLTESMETWNIKRILPEAAVP